MNLRTRRLMVVAILVFAAFSVFGASQSPAATAGRSTHQVAVGVNSVCGYSAFGALQTAQVQWTRISLPWSDIQPYDPATTPPSYQGKSFDPAFLKAFKSCVDQARISGMKVLVVFQEPPSWAVDADGLPDPTAYASAIGAVAQAIPEISAFEILNEENMHRNWPGTPLQYVQLLQAAYTAVKKQANPPAPPAMVIVGGTEHNGAVWLNKLYNAGARGYFDAFADHPYPPHKSDGLWKDSLSTVRKARAVMVAHGDAAKPIWVTEFGWSRTAVSPEKQSRLVPKSYSFFSLHETYVKVAFWYQAKDTCTDSTNWGCELGLLDYYGVPTPAYYALAQYDARHTAS